MLYFLYILFEVVRGLNMRYILFISLSLLFGLQIKAQTDDHFRLRMLTASEFLNELPDFNNIPLPDYQDTQLNQRTLGYVIEATEAEFLSQYENEADFVTLALAFEKFKLPIYCYPIPRCTYLLPEINYAEWFKRIVESWMEENPTDLDDVDTLQFRDYTIYVEQRDFNADGKHEWLFDVVKGQTEIEYGQYLVVSRTEQGYQISSVPLGGTLSWWQHAIDEQPLAERAFEDINADGLPEWVFNWTRSGGGLGSFSYSTHTVFLGWRNGEIVELGDFTSIDTTFENIDNDTALEVLTSPIYNGDYWGCGYTEQSQYDWDGESYIEVEPYITQSDCTARYAENAMWAWNFETAIEYYDAFIKSHADNYQAFRDCIVANELDCDYNKMNRDTLIYLHFQVRHILAHALLGHEATVSQLLDELAAEPFHIDFAQVILDTNSTDAETLCRTAYNYFAENHTILSQWEEYMRFYPGHTIRDDGTHTVYNKPIDPIRAGCDIRIFTNEPTPVPTLTPTPYPTFAPATPDARSDEQIWIDTQNFYDAFRAENYDVALSIAQHAAPTDDFVAGQWGYARAIALEALDLPEEALTEYLTLYNDMPDSVWGLLAAMHLEAVAP
jgi:hypothetical protein